MSSFLVDNGYHSLGDASEEISLAGNNNYYSAPCTPLSMNSEDTSPFEYGISVVIPCLNESATLAACIDELTASMSELSVPYEIIVADNNSSDNSAQIAREKGAVVIPVALRGYGRTVDAGIKKARFKAVVFADADLSYPFDKVHLLAQPILDGSVDVVLASRLSGNVPPGAMPFLNRYVGTPALSWLIRFLYKIPVSDSNSGMRAIARHKYEELGLSCSGMEYASEMLIQVAEKKLRYGELSINFRKDGRGTASHLRRWIDGCRNLDVILLRPLTTYRRVSFTINDLLLILFTTLLLIVPALLNGFPFYNEDSIGYLYHPNGLQEPPFPYRSIGYSWVMALAYLWPNDSLWCVIAFQSLSIAYIINVLLRCFTPDLLNKTLHKLIVPLLLCCSTAVAGFSSTLLPDIFAPVLALAYYVFAFKGDALCLFEKAILIFLILISICVHFSHVALALLLFLFSVVTFFVTHHAITRRAVLIAGVTLAIGISILPARNYFFNYGAVVSNHGHVWFMSRLVDDGIIVRQLAEHCSNQRYELCNYKYWFTRSNKPSAYIWDAESPFYVIGGWKNSYPIHNKMIYESVVEYPVMHLIAVLRGTVRLFFDVDYFEYLTCLSPGSISLFAQYWMSESNSIVTAIQTQMIKGISFSEMIKNALFFIRKFLVYSSLLSLLYCGCLFFCPKRYTVISHSMRLLNRYIVGFLIANAFICSVFSGQFARYQDRVLWLPMLVVLLSFPSLFEKKIHRSISSASHQ